jgi:hypothetical protein
MGTPTATGEGTKNSRKDESRGSCVSRVTLLTIFDRAGHHGSACDWTHDPCGHGDSVDGCLGCGPERGLDETVERCRERCHCATQHGALRVQHGKVLGHELRVLVADQCGQVFERTLRRQCALANALHELVEFFVHARIHRTADGLERVVKHCD